MRWDYFKVFKQIREDKHLSQSKIAGKMMTRQAVAAFEDGKSTPRFENMEYMLQQMDMTFAEFQYICDYYQPTERMKILQEIQKFDSLTSQEQIERLIKRCQDYLKTIDDLPIERCLLVLQVHLASIHERKPGESKQSQELYRSIWNELQRYDEWYLGDLHLLVRILPHFSIEHIIDITNQILNSLKRYEEYANIKEARFSILTNLASCFLYNAYPDKASELTEMALKTAKSTHRSDYLGFCWVRIGIIEKDEHLIHKGILLLETAEEIETLNNCKQEIKQFFPSFSLT